MSEARYLEALEELEALKECAPKEASVFFLMVRAGMDCPTHAILRNAYFLTFAVSLHGVNSVISIMLQYHALF